MHSQGTREDAVRSAASTGRGDVRTPDPLLHPSQDPPAFVLNADTLAILDVNKSAVRHYGYTREELLTKFLADLHPPEEAAEILAYVAGAAEAGPLRGKQCRHVRKDGSIMEVELSLSRLHLGSEDPWYMVVRNITREMRQTRELRQREEESRRQADLAHAFALSPVGMVLTTADRRFLHVNAAYCALIGYSADELLGQDFLTVTDAADRAENLARFEQLLAGQIPAFQFEKRYVRKDGRAVWARTSARLQRDEEGRPLHVIGLVEDISARKEAEEELAQERARLAATLDHLPEAVLSALPDGTLDFANRHWNDFVGAPVGRLDADFLRCVVHPEDLQRTVSGWEHSLRTGEPYACLHRLRRKDGEYRWIFTRAAAQCDETGRVIRWSGSGTDITELRQAEEAVRRGRAQLAAILNNLKEGVVVFDQQRRITDLNPAAVEINGYGSIEEARRRLNESPEAFEVSSVDGTPLAPSQWPVPRVLRGESFSNLVVAIRCQDTGKHYIASISGSPVRDQQTDYGLGVFTLVDITAQTRAEEARRESEERLRLAVEGARQAVWDWDVKSGVLTWDARCREIFGVPADANLDFDAFASMVHPTDRDHVLEGVRSALRERAPLHEEYRIVRPDGAVRWILARGLAIHDERGEAVRMSGTTLDVTEQVEARLALEGAEQRERERAAEIEALMRATPISILVAHDPECRVISANPAGYRLLRLPPGRTFHSSSVPERDPRHYHMARDGRPLRAEELPLQLAARGNREVTNQEMTLVFDDGEMRHLVGNAVPLHDASGFVRGAIGAFTDVTEFKLTQRALQEADRRKDEFLATLAHELRNPLAPLANALEIMKRAAGDSTRAEQAREMMERQLRHLVRLVDDLLELSRITTGKLALRKDRVEVSAVLRGAAEGAETLIRRFDHALHITFPATQLYLEGDYTRLTQVVANLMTNAAKYTTRGGSIAVSAGQDGDEIFIEVSDSGIGIPQDKLESIFDMFSQLHLPGGSSSEGLGIGLHLSRRLVQMHGGTITAHSAGPGTGTRMTVRLPLAPQRRTPRLAMPEAKETSHSLRVLVVDDNVDATESMGVLLELMNHQVRTANDGPAGLLAAEAFRPQVVLLDLGMPGMDGYETARAIRSQPWGGSVFLCALSGWGQDEDRRRTREAGFDHHLLKPADPGELEKLFAQLAQAPLGETG